MYTYTQQFSMDIIDIEKIIKENTVFTTNVKPIKCISLGYSEIVEYYEYLYSQIKSIKEIKKYMSNKNTITVDKLNNHLKFTYGSVFYEMNEVFSQYSLFDKTSKCLFINDANALSLLASKQFNDYQLCVFSKEIIPSHILSQLDKSKILESTNLNSDELYNECFVNELKNSKYDFILFQNYLNSKQNAYNEYHHFAGLTSKIFVGITLQNFKGNMVIKLISVSYKITAKLINFASLFYKKVHLYNCEIQDRNDGEQYLILEEFLFKAEDIQKITKNLFLVLEHVIHSENYIFDIFDNLKLNVSIQNIILNFNSLVQQKKLKRINTFLQMCDNIYLNENDRDIDNTSNYIKKYFNF